MNKKLLSIIMASLLAVSTAAVSAGAAEIEQESSKSGTFFFDGGSGWENQTVCFYIWDGTTNEWATKDGWITTDTWGSKKKIGAAQVEGKETVYESYELDLSGREDHSVYVIFHSRDTGGQTMDCLINESVFGNTAHAVPSLYENPVDSEQTAQGVQFDGGTGVGIPKVITSSGIVQGDIIPPDKTPESIVARFVLQRLGHQNKVTGLDVVTEESVANAIAEFGTNKDAVWAEYQTYSGEENYNEEEAKKVIKPTFSSVSSTTSTGYSSVTSTTSTGYSSVTSTTSTGYTSVTSKTSSAVSTKTASDASATGVTSKPSTTVSGTSSTSSTGSSSSGSSSDTKSPKTGVVTNYAAMLAALFTSGAAVAFAGKKRKEND